MSGEKRSVGDIIRDILHGKEASEEAAFTPKEIGIMEKSRELGIPVNLPKKQAFSRRFKKEP